MKKSIFIISILVIISCVMIGFGIYFIKLSSYKNITSSAFDKIFADFEKTFIVKHDYMYLDSLSYSSDIKINTNSLKENISSIEGEKLQKFLTRIYNMNGSNTNISFERDFPNKQYLLKFNSEVKEKKYEGKILVSNSTKYYYLKDYTKKKYINDGSNNYFESITKEDRDNITYLINFIKADLKNQLTNNDDNIVKTKANQEIDGVTAEYDKLSISLDKNRIKSILNKMHDNLVNDKRSNYIISNYYKDFEKFKFDKKNLKLTNFTLCIYTYGLEATPAKIEVKYTFDNNNYILIYEYGKDINKGNFIKNNVVVYNFTDKITNNGRIITLTDRNMLDSGKITISNKKDDYNIDLEIKKDNKTIRFNYSDKVTTTKKDASYENDRRIYYNILDNKEFSFEINIKSLINTNTNIEEDITDSILKSSLSEEEREKIDNYKKDILEYLES